jgi:hypothetical protein
MKEQFVGDVNDYRKYALIRHLARAGGVTVGMCWMLTLPEVGNLRQYLSDADRWRGYDGGLFDQLRTIIELQEVSRLAAIEASSIIPEARFFNAILTDKTNRAAYFKDALAALADAELIFFDPDNGVSPKLQKRGSQKFVYVDEISAAYEQDHSVLVYQHFPRVPRDQFIHNRRADFSSLMPIAQQWCFTTPFAAFFLLVHPKHSAGLIAAACNIPEHWRPRFIDAKPL